MKNKNFQPIIYALLIIAGILISNISYKPEESKIKNKKINGILDLIQDHYVDTINNEEFHL